LLLLGKDSPSDQKEGAEERLRWFQAAVAAAPDSLVARCKLADALEDRGLVDRAVACYQKALDIDPNSPHALCGLGNMLLVVKHDYDGAIARFQKAIAHAPNLAPLHSNLGRALYQKGQLEQAIACQQQAIALDPKLAQAHANLGLALRDKGRLDKAIAS